VEEFGVIDLDLAVRLYRAIDDPGMRAVLDFLIDHPDERFEGAAIAESLGLPRHRDTARATFAYGEVARSMGRARPWQEGQLGYQMSADQAALLRRARDRATTRDPA
jgi:predicted AAA+ superfamily ATPase